MQRRALGFLFTLLALGLLGIAVAAVATTDRGVRWRIAAAALALAAWLGTAAAQALRK